MKKSTITTLAIGSGLALVAVLAFGSAAHAAPAAPAAGTQMTPAQMQEHCKTMMEHKKAMAADIQAEDAALTAAVDKMNRAPADQQIALMAAVITKLAEQRVARDEHQAKMDAETMQHMAEHMQMGKDSMGQCPMMKDMKGMAGMKGMTGK